MEKRVIISGMDIISALGLNLEENWNNLLAGKSGVKNITNFDASNNLTKFAAEVSEKIHEEAKEKIPLIIRKQMTRVTIMGYLSAIKAVEDSKINFNDYDRERCAIITGIVSNSSFQGLKDYTEKYFIVREMNNALGAWLAIEYKLEGPCFSIATACASSAYAIGIGYDLIKTGKSDIVLVGGADSHVEKKRIAGFNELYALSKKNNFPETASCPFSKNRSGFVMGEGAGFLILESEEMAIKRNAKIYAEILGYAITSEGYKIVTPKTDGTGMSKTMKMALKNSNTYPENVDYINAHGTSTNLNDKYETMAIKDVFKERANKLSISSSKSMIGHTLGASGVIESAITAMSIYHGKITPTINYFEPDAELDLDYTPNHSKNKKINVALSNSFGFGGHNATIVLKKYNKIKE